MAWIDPKETQLAVMLDKISELYLKMVELQSMEKLHRAKMQIEAAAQLRQRNADSANGQDGAQ